jgi:hypothetical protein
LKQYTGCVWLLVSIVALGCSVDADPDAGDEFRAAGPPGDFEAAYVGCEEFAGVGLVPLANVAELVPDDYVIIEPIPGFAIVVAQSASCDEISVNGQHARPGIFAQFGVAVVPPLEPGSGDFYQIFFTTDHPQLAASLRRLGVAASMSPQLSYEIADDTLAIDVPKPHRLAFELSGPITAPDPDAAPNPTTVFNYYAQSERYGNVLQQNVVEGIIFGEGSGVVLTAIGEDMEAIIGGEFLMFPFFSSPEIFDRADVLVQTDAF